MDIERKLNIYDRYRRFFKGCKIPFSCLYCEKDILPESFEDHCDSKHGMDSTTRCVWCRGNFMWRKGEKYENIGHVYLCARKMLMATPNRIQIKQQRRKLPYFFDPSPPSLSPTELNISFDDESDYPSYMVTKYFGDPEELVLSVSSPPPPPMVIIHRSPPSSHQIKGLNQLMNVV